MRARVCDAEVECERRVALVQRELERAAAEHGRAAAAALMERSVAEAGWQRAAEEAEVAHRRRLAKMEADHAVQARDRRDRARAEAAGMCRPGLLN